MFYKPRQRPSVKSVVGKSCLWKAEREKQRLKQWEEMRRRSVMEKWWSGDLSQLLTCSLVFLFFYAFFCKVRWRTSLWKHRWTHFVLPGVMHVYVCVCACIFEFLQLKFFQRVRVWVSKHASVIHLWMLSCKCDTTSVCVSVSWWYFYPLEDNVWKVWMFKLGLCQRAFSQSRGLVSGLRVEFKVKWMD